MVVINPIDGVAAAKDPSQPANPEPEVSPPQYHQYSHPAPSGSTSYAVPQLSPPLLIPPPKPPVDLSYSRPIAYSLRCLYASLAICIFMFILEMTPWCQPMLSLWFFPVGYMLTVIFSSAVIMVTFRDRARIYQKGWGANPTPRLPTLCSKGAIVPCFLLVVYWCIAEALVLWVKVTGLLYKVVASLLLRTLFLTKLNDAETAPLILILGLVEAVCVAAQIGLLLAVGIMGSIERKRVKRRLREESGDA